MGFNFKRLLLLSVALYNSIGVNKEPQRPPEALIFIFVFFCSTRIQYKVVCLILWLKGILWRYDSCREGEALRHHQAALSQAAASSHWEKLLEVILASDQKASWTLPCIQFGGIPERIICSSGLECHMITQKELEDLTVETDVWTTSFSRQPQQSPTAPETKWMEVHQ